MKELDLYKFRQQINIFKSTLAPSAKQLDYLEMKKQEIREKIVAEAGKAMVDVEREMLVCICGELTLNSSKQEQAEFATRLLLLDLLTEQS